MNKPALLFASYHFLESALIFPLGSDQVLVVDDEVALPARRAGQDIFDGDYWISREMQPGVNRMPESHVKDHRGRYPSAPEPEEWQTYTMLELLSLMPAEELNHA